MSVLFVQVALEVRVSNMTVIKRDGTVVPFDRERIEVAVIKAFKEVTGKPNVSRSKKVAKEVEKHCKELDEPITVTKIEELVFNNLCDHSFKTVARCYEAYRSVREYKRTVNTTDESILNLIHNSNDEVTRENSNKDSRLASTQRDLIAGEVSKDIARRKLIPSHILQAHDTGVLHYHDMDYSIQPIFNCCLVDLEDMLQNGTVISGKLIEPPSRFITACTIASQIVAQVSSGQYGGQSITIKHLAPFLRKSFDKHLNMFTNMGYYDPEREILASTMVLKELEDGIQTLRYQLNTLQTSNGQHPFITVYLEIDHHSEYVHEEKLIVEEMLRQRIKGMKNYLGQRVYETFPKLVLSVDNNILNDKPLLRLIAECMTKTMMPDLQSSKHMCQNYGDKFPPMGCRSHLSPYVDETGKQKWYGRFNQGVVSLNLAQIGILANGDEQKMWSLLDERLELVREALMVRHNLLKGTTSDVSPIHWQHGAIARLGKGEVIDNYLMDGYSTLSLGYVGLHELCVAMGHTSITTEYGQALSLIIMKYMRARVDQWKEESGLGFALYGTPAESLIYTFAKKDLAQFGSIDGVTDKGYYTNSYHVPVTEEIWWKDKLQLEAKFHSISSGGCISYIEIPNMTDKYEVIEVIIKYMYENVQYAEINTRSDLCFKCSYDGEIKVEDDYSTWKCPKCGNTDMAEMMVLRRSCGYLGSNYWNEGRTKEINERVLHLK